MGRKKAITGQQYDAIMSDLRALVPLLCAKHQVAPSTLGKLASLAGKPA